MRKLPEQEEKIKRAIRDIVVVDPLISVERMCNALYDKGLKTAHNTPLKWHYIAKLRKKVRRESVEHVNRTVLAERVAEFKEKNRIVFDRLIRIAFYTDDLKRESTAPPSYRDQIMALSKIVQLDLATFGAELDAKIFERHIELLESERRFIPLPQELKTQMLRALINWGIIPPEQKEDADSNNTTTAIVVAKQ